MSAIYPVPSQSLNGSLTRYTSPSAGEGTAGKLVKTIGANAQANTGGRLYKLRVMNKAATAYTVMVFDKVIAPVNGDSPIWRATLPNVIGGEVEIDFNLWGMAYILGLGLAISSTSNTLTLAVANDALFHALYV